MTAAAVTPLPVELTQPGGSAFPDEYLYAITNAIVNHPRSLQRSIGPSELGHPCSRRIAYKLMAYPEVEKPPNWLATIGTGTHLWLETAFDLYNTQNAHLMGGQERFYVETKVSVGEVNGVEITGSCDLYDRVTETVVDHKVVGPTQLTKYKRHGPSDQYRTQAHLYGRGWRRAGLNVSTVMIAFLPRNGELADAYIWHEPYDEQVALDALQRLAGIDLATKTLGDRALEILPTADAWCHHCAFFLADSADLQKGCPGDPASKVHSDNSSQFNGII